MKQLVTQLAASFVATGLITFTVTHLHADLIAWSLWALHWLIAWPIAFAVTRWLAPQIRKILDVYMV
jgi:hypothetical protein